MTHRIVSPLPRHARWLSAIAAATLLAACASPEPRLYTLAAGAEPAAAAATAASPAAGQPVWIEVAPVRVPERLNRKQLVVRDGGGDALTLLEQSRWSAPLPDELRDALSQRLQVVLGAVDVYQQGLSDVQPLYRVTTEVIRMDAELGQRAAATINWTVRRLPDGKMVAGRTQADLPAPGGAEGVVAAYRQVVNNTAADIAAAMDGLRLNAAR
ncbi:PqiC family protein [Cupriavidus respiraculi]|uniref:PqiC family protein n=1 Tax=Cupriavidus respiraculi TaxID=195930 RepID=UPI002D802511|nr:PqiC family protein [Cupriavidus respiraculi]